MKMAIGGRVVIVNKTGYVPSLVAESKPTTHSRHSHGENLAAMQLMGSELASAEVGDRLSDDEFDPAEVSAICIPSTGRHL